MFKQSKIGAAAALIASGVIPMLAVPAYAQSTTTVEKAETVVVTGSRIVRPNLTSTTPIVAVNAETMANLGMENFADMATQLPQFAPAFGSSRTQSTFSGVGASGLNNANLRNLGAGRSLVLINGRRVPGGSSTGTAVDFNSIPTSNIDRIEISTGGASAVYGADAMAGVVNIITKKNVRGVELGVSYGEAGRGDNKNPSASVVMGGRFGDAGRAMLTMEFTREGHVRCADRDICSDDFAWLSPGSPVFGPTARSGVGATGRFFVGANSFTRRGSSFTDANGALIPFSVPVDGYNRNAARDLAIPTKRILVAGDAEYKVTKNITAYGEFNYANNSINSSFEGHPFQSNANTFGGQQTTIPINNPFIPAQLRAAAQAAGVTEMTWWQRFGDETIGGNRGASSDRTMVRTVFGAKGEFDSIAGFGRDWTWDASHTFGRTRVNLGTEGSVSLSQLYHGLRVEADPTRPGQFRCVDAIARGNGCVPINPFAPYTADMARALTVSTTSIGANSLNDSVVSLSGTVMKLPAGDLRTAVGAQYRSFSGYLDHDTQINLGNVTGNRLGDIDKTKTSTREMFAELLVPVLADKPFANSLNVTGAFRGSKAGEKKYDTWNLGGDWEPTDGLRFRAMQSRSVRTPQPGELSGIGQTFGVINDPCTAARRNANPTRAANCAADGVPANYAPALAIEQSVEGLSGGNAKLNPEKGTTLTYGLVFQPTFLKGLAIAVDRFDIEVTDMITTVSRQVATNLCYDTPNRLLCGSLTRGTNPLLPGATYVLRAVNEELQNVASMNIKGVDLDVRYAFKAGAWGDFDLSAVATIYDEALLVPLAGNAPVNLLGQAGGSTSDQGFIKFTANGNVSWKKGPFKANWNMRHIGRADMAVGTTAAGYPQIGAHTYHNARIGYSASKNADFYIGVTNLFDKKPPFFASGSSGTQALDTIPGYYDIFGRSYFVGANFKF
ncbi:TonB-dependent receptor domain-containing protein [Roseateles sp.]|jgi:iron complex outermembrane receptor protein|uniref:TonB-dependent receptor domain-containing protein n=1 Tax=Roseateles sp. TaxID=1971397 RepID=UPI0037C8CF6B